MTVSRRKVALALSAMLWASSALAAPESDPELDGPTLNDRLAHAPTVILGRVEAIARRARVRVEEVLRGHATAPIEVAFRGDNYLREPGTRPATFEEGERTLLLLQPATERGRPVPGRYRLVGGPRGKISLPAEGQEAFLLVVRRLVSIQEIDGQAERWAETRRLLDERDQRLAHVGLSSVAAFRLADEGLLPTLLRYLQHPAPMLRVQAIRALEQMVRPQGTLQPSPSSEAIVAQIEASARGDGDQDVRAAALHVLGGLRRADLADLFREAALRDPSQLVRYEASVALSDLGQSLPPRQEAPSPSR